MFKILESHSNHTSTDNSSTNSVLLKSRHSVDDIHFFGPNLKSEEKKYSLSQCPNINKVNFSFSFFITGSIVQEDM